MRLAVLIICLVTLTTYNNKWPVVSEVEILQVETIVAKDSIIKDPPAAAIFPAGAQRINTGSTQPGELLAFAMTLIGTPYRYASVDPAIGFDCSGFITYTFNHFRIAVPRSSIDFTNVEGEISLTNAKPGDLVLFTGTDSSSRVVGHMGIISSKENGEFYFIHSTSGKANGVTISSLSKYYSIRFVKVIRIFPQNDQ